MVYPFDVIPDQTPEDIVDKTDELFTVWLVVSDDCRQLSESFPASFSELVPVELRLEDARGILHVVPCDEIIVDEGGIDAFDQHYDRFLRP